jgi:hypothetical protein
MTLQYTLDEVQPCPQGDTVPRIESNVTCEQITSLWSWKDLKLSSIIMSKCLVFIVSVSVYVLKGSAGDSKSTCMPMVEYEYLLFSDSNSGIIQFSLSPQLRAIIA